MAVDFGQSSFAPAGLYRFRVGAFSCILISDEDRSTVSANLYSRVPAETVQQVLRERYCAIEDAPSQLSALFVDMGEQKVLIDAGLGVLSAPDVKSGFGLTPPPTGSPPGRIRRNLEAAGIPPDAITHLLLSHLYPDHIGGVFNPQGRLAFHNARVVCSRAEADFWRSTPDLTEVRLPANFKHLMIQMAQTLLVDLADQLLLVDPQPEQDLFPGITALAAPGHTPGHLAFTVTSHEQTLLVVGDAWEHHLLSPEHPEWECDLDQAPKVAVATRKALLARAANTGALVAAYHFNWPSLGHIRRLPGDSPERWAWEPIEYCWA